jgi:hypothetical protein
MAAKRTQGWARLDHAIEKIGALESFLPHS